jgi:hypothetical protein
VATIHDIWVQNPSTPTEYWLPGVFVTAMSRGACPGGGVCEIFVQQAETFASLADGSQQAIRIVVSPDEKMYFAGLHVGDQIDVDGFAFRDVAPNELHLQASALLPGCAKTVGSGNPTPVQANQGDLTPSAYLNSVGPLLVSVTNVTGRVVSVTHPFPIWFGSQSNNPGDAFVDPRCLPEATFVGLTEPQDLDLFFVTAVFGITADSLPRPALLPRTMGQLLNQ